MSVRKIDENGVYREYDSKTNSFIDYPLTNNLGQMEHQTVSTLQGNIIDPDEVDSNVIDENGIAVIEEDETKIRQFIKEAISIDSLVKTFNQNSHETLLRLLALQSNKQPLKKGGIGVAYRTDALIMHCKMEFTAEENVVFDAILGTMSSLPHNDTYRIEPSSFKKMAKYADEKYLYKVFRRGTEKLSERNLTFENLGPEGEDSIKVPWFNILRYHKPKKGDNAYIEFVPSDFFKDLALCSGIVHGAYGAIEVTTQLQGKYTIAIYWYLENRKNYKEYPTATPGIFDLSLEELKYQFSIPDYGKTDIERRVLNPARESINNVSECDFTWDYEPRKVNGKLAGYTFIVKNKNYIDSTAVEINEIEDKQGDSYFADIKMICSMSKINFSDSELQRIAACAKRYNKDAAYMMLIIGSFKQRLDNKTLEPIEDKVAYLCRMIEQGVNPVNTKSPKNFNDFSQRDYDFNQLENALLNNKRD